MCRLISSLYNQKSRWITALAIVVAVAAIVTARNWSNGSANPPFASNTASSQNGNIEVEIVTVRPWGFEPKEITRPPGPFFLALDNQSELSEIDVSLDQEEGPKLKGAGITRNKRKWREKMTLPPGTYVLREANNPDWICRIVIRN